MWVDTKNGPPVNTPKALTGAWAKKQASVNAGVKTPPGLGCEFFSFAFCVLRKCDRGLMVLCTQGINQIMMNNNSKPTEANDAQRHFSHYEQWQRGEECECVGSPLPGGKPNTSPSATRPPNSPWGPIVPRSGNVREFSLSFSRTRLVLTRYRQL